MFPETKEQVRRKSAESPGISGGSQGVEEGDVGAGNGRNGVGLTGELTGPVAEHRDTEAWLERRKKHATASDIAAILGLNPFKGPAQVQGEKLGFRSSDPENAAMRRGKLLEPVAAIRYTEETGRNVRRQPFRARGLVGASMDRQILAGPNHSTGPLELKVPGYHVFQKVRREGLPDWWILQGQVEAWVWGYDYSAFGILHADSMRLIHFDVEARDDLMGEVVPRVEAWWERHIVNREPVPEDAAPPAVEIPEELRKAEIVTRDDPEFLQAVAELMDARELRDTATALYNEITNRLKEELGVGAFEGGGVRLHVIESAGRTSFDHRALEKVAPLDRVKVAAWLTGQAGGAAQLDELVASFALDLEPFRKTGKPSVSLRPYRIQAEEAWT